MTDNVNEGEPPVARRIFYSFYYREDAWRVSKVREIGTVEGQPLLTSNQWEDVEKKGKAGIQAWIDEQMKGKSCVVVLIGSNTASRPWVKYEIEKGWADGKGVVGIHIYNLLDHNQKQSAKGANPLAGVTIGTGANAKKLSSIAKTYDPGKSDSKDVYAWISTHLANAVEEAINIRAAN